MAEERALTTNDTGSSIEAVIAKGDLSKLTPDERVRYYTEVCRSMGLNPLTQPFAYITLNGKLTLYAGRGCADQLRRIHNVSVDKPTVELVDDIMVVTVTGHMPDGRIDTEIGAVAVGGLKGEAKANATMKAITKAKRRLTLSMIGLGWLDETEVDTIPDAKHIAVTAEGEIIDGDVVPEPRFLDHEANRSKVRAQLEKRGITPEDAAAAVTKWQALDHIKTRADVWTQCEVLITAHEQQAPPAEAAATPAAEAPPVAKPKATAPDWVAEVKLAAMKAKLKVGIRDNIIAAGLANGGTRDDLLADIAEAAQKYADDPDGVTDYWESVARETEGERPD